VFRYVASAGIAAALLISIAVLLNQYVWTADSPAIVGVSDLSSDSRPPAQESDCSDLAETRLSATPSPLEYEVIIAAIRYELGTTPNAILVNQAFHVTPQDLARLGGFAERQRLEYSRIIEPSVIQALELLSPGSSEFEADRFSNLPVIIATEDQVTELFENRDPEDVSHIIGEYTILRFSRAGIGCSLQQAAIYTTTSCGSLCGGGGILVLELLDGQWQVVGSTILWVS
jgi:hypothetical protein